MPVGYVLKLIEVSKSLFKNNNEVSSYMKKKITTSIILISCLAPLFYDNNCSAMDNGGFSTPKKKKDKFPPALKRIYVKRSKSLDIEDKGFWTAREEEEYEYKKKRRLRKASQQLDFKIGTESISFKEFLERNKKTREKSREKSKRDIDNEREIKSSNLEQKKFNDNLVYDNLLIEAQRKYKENKEKERNKGGDEEHKTTD